ncbi:metallophosphoesterase, partial [candidate division WOR-3 bacterium]|nr:metallophosphoesterase [candidate division WOR-3 bacterium]
MISLSCLGFIISSCTKPTEPEDETLSFSFPLLNKKHDLYYHLDHNARSIELLFNEDIDQSTVNGSIGLSDKNASLNSQFDIGFYGKLLTLQFHRDFSLNDGWKYLLTITKDLKSVNGMNLKNDTTVELRTTGEPIHVTDSIKTIKGTIQRNSIVCISDVHMGDSRATTENHCEFKDNAEALENFLDFILISPKVKQLILCGDLLDEWMVPYDVAPFDSLVGIHNSEDYFQAIANNSVNFQIFDKFRDIANHPNIELVYIPGNHDMLVTQDIIE